MKIRTPLALASVLLLVSAGAFASGDSDEGSADEPVPLILSAWGGQEVADFYAANAAEFSRLSQAGWTPASATSPPTTTRRCRR